MFKTENGSAHNIDKWDLIIAHPPCTYLSNAATRSHSLKGATLEQINEILLGIKGLGTKRVECIIAALEKELA